jgi:hypothetical protein
MKTYKILSKYKYDIQPKWEDEKLLTGGKYFFSFREAQEYKKKIQRLTSSFQYKVQKIHD